MSTFQKATKAAAKLRLGLVGPAGSGKTMTALRIAAGLGGRVAVIDTERGSASLYSGDRDFDVMELDTYEVERFIDGIKAAVDGGYSVLIIDSLSHAWAGKGGILEFVDKAGKRNQGGGNFGAWRDATPRHNALVDAILGAPLHVIVTLRSKVEYVVEQGAHGRTQVRKVGLQPVQRDGLEYEFTVVGDVTQDHDLVVTKTRAAFLKDQVIREAGEDLGRQLAAWLADGESPAAKRPELKPAKSSDVPGLMTKASKKIAAATSSDEIASCRRRVDAYLADGTFSTAQWEALTDQIDARSASIEGVPDGVA